MSTPYYLYSDDPTMVFDALDGGLIAPDGNFSWGAYQSWLEAGNEPEIRDRPIDPRVAALMAKGFTEEIAKGIVGI